MTRPSRRCSSRWRCACNRHGRPQPRARTYGQRWSHRRAPALSCGVALDRHVRRATAVEVELAVGEHEPSPASCTLEVDRRAGGRADGAGKVVNALGGEHVHDATGGGVVDRRLNGRAPQRAGGPKPVGQKKKKQRRPGRRRRQILFTKHAKPTDATNRAPIDHRSRETGPPTREPPRDQTPEVSLVQPPPPPPTTTQRAWSRVATCSSTTRTRPRCARSPATSPTASSRRWPRTGTRPRSSRPSRGTPSSALGCSRSRSARSTAAPGSATSRRRSSSRSSPAPTCRARSSPSSSSTDRRARSSTSATTR